MKYAILAILLIASPAAANTVRIVVPAHDIARGDVIGESDLTYTTVDGNALMSGNSWPVCCWPANCVIKKEHG